MRNMPPGIHCVPRMGVTTEILSVERCLSLKSLDGGQIHG